MGPEWKDEDIILGVDFLNHYKRCLKFHKDGTIRLDWGEERDKATNNCGPKQPTLYPVKWLNAEEVRAALCQKFEEADLNQQQKKQLMDLLLLYEDCFIFGLEKPGQSTTKHSIKLLGNPQPIKAKPRRVSAALEKPGQSTTKHSIELLGNPQPIKAKPRRVSAALQKWKRCSRKESFNLHKAIGLQRGYPWIGEHFCVFQLLFYLKIIMVETIPILVVLCSQASIEEGRGGRRSQKCSPIQG